MPRRETPNQVATTALLTSCLILLAGCGQKATQQRPTGAVKVTVASPLEKPIVEWDEYTGRLTAIESVEVRARVSGYLETTHFEEGKIVRQGDLLAIIDPRPFEAELNAAKARLQEAQARLSASLALLRQSNAEKADSDAQLTLADRRLDRARRLRQTNAISQEELDVRVSEQLQAAAAIEAADAKIETSKAGIATSAAAIETARANLEAADLNLQYTRIRAPIGGRISRRYVTEGNLISGGTNQATLLTSIVSITPIHVYFDVNEQEFLKYVRLDRAGKRGSSRDTKNPVFVALMDEEGFPHTGQMDFVDNRVDPNTGTMRGRAILANEDGLLTPGLFVKVRLPGSGRYDAVMVPDSAIGSDQSEKFVYVVGNGNSVERRTVALGPISHGLRIVRTGLDGSELIVVRGLQSVYPGVTIEATKATIEPELSELPDDYASVPADRWLSPTPAGLPTGRKANAEPYRDPSSGATSETQRE